MCQDRTLNVTHNRSRQPVLEGISLFHRSNTHSNRQVRVSIFHGKTYTHKTTDRHRLAFALIQHACTSGTLCLIPGPPHPSPADLCRKPSIRDGPCQALFGNQFVVVFDVHRLLLHRYYHFVHALKIVKSGTNNHRACCAVHMLHFQGGLGWRCKGPSNRG